MGGDREGQGGRREEMAGTGWDLPGAEIPRVPRGRRVLGGKSGG